MGDTKAEENRISKTQLELRRSEFQRLERRRETGDGEALPGVLNPLTVMVMVMIKE